MRWSLVLMALIYSQGFDAGPPLTAISGVYDTENLEDVVSGAGVDGGYGVRPDAGSESLAGFVVQTPSAGTTAGSVSVWYRFDPDLIGDANPYNYWPLIDVYVTVPATNLEVNLVLVNGANSWPGADGTADDIYFGVEAGGDTFPAVRVGSASEVGDGQFHRVRLCWQNNAAITTSFDATTVNSIDGTGYTWTTSWDAVAFGYAGLAGDVDRIEIYDDTTACGAVATPLIDNSEACCTACTCPTSSAATPTGTTGPVLPTITPLWTPACTGGGTVTTAADLTDSESWAD